MKKLITLASLLVALPLLFIGCATSHDDSTAEEAPKILRVGVTANYTPIIFKDEGGKIVGLEADFAEALGAELRSQIEYVELEWEDQIPALEEGQIDIIMGGMTITDLRSTRVDFTEPYMRAGQMALIRRDDQRTFKHPQLIVFGPTKIGVETGTAGDAFVQNRCTNAKRKNYDSIEKAIEDLKDGKIDVFVHDAPVIWNYATQNKYHGLVAVNDQLTDEYLAWAVQKGNDELRRAANRARFKWIESGLLNDLVAKWVPLD